MAVDESERIRRLRIKVKDADRPVLVHDNRMLAEGASIVHDNRMLAERAFYCLKERL